MQIFLMNVETAKCQALRMYVALWMITLNSRLVIERYVICVCEAWHEPHSFLSFDFNGTSGLEKTLYACTRILGSTSTSTLTIRQKSDWTTTNVHVALDRKIIRLVYYLSVEVSWMVLCFTYVLNKYLWCNNQGGWRFHQVNLRWYVGSLVVGRRFQALSKYRSSAQMHLVW